ncbi:MAG: hypothetical protein AAF664_24765 [Planctomycetota bacterium]
MSTQFQYHGNRREALKVIGLGLGSGLAVSGCSRPAGDSGADSEEGSEAIKSSVPLAVIVVGPEDLARSIEMSWSAVSEQALSIQSLAPEDVATRGEGLVGDCVIYPAISQGDLIKTQVLAGLKGDDYSAMIESVPDSIMRTCGRTESDVKGIPIATSIPVIATNAENAEEARQEVSFPLDPVEAADAFLLYAGSSASQWLFNIRDMSPLVGEDEYVSLLTQLKGRAELWKSSQQKINVAEGINMGDVLTGWTNLASVDPGINATLVGASGSDPALVPSGLTLIGGLCRKCRQSRLAKAFIGWLAGGEGLSQIAATLAGTIVTGNESNYPPIAQEFFSRFASRSPLRIPGGQRYQISLGKAVTGVLFDGDDPKANLSKCSEQWRRITRELGESRQLAAWRACNDPG